MAFRFRFPGETLAVAGAVLLLAAGCTHAPSVKPVVRTGDEIVAAGEWFHTGTRVVNWSEPGGYDAYTGRAPVATKPGNLAPVTFGFRPLEPRGEKPILPPARPANLKQLRGLVDQFVLHYDESGLSKVTFDVLQKRSLSVHFLLDLDGTIYQTLDLRERAWHATTSNDRSIGIEIANIGAYPPKESGQVFQPWYKRGPAGQMRIDPPLALGNPRFHTPGFVGRPLRPEPVRGLVQGRELVQYDFTPEQYAALIKLTAALCRVFPNLKCDYPRDAAGKLVTQKLPDPVLAKYRGVIGHFHIQENKIDPGPALQWDLLINGARRELKR